MKYLKIVAVLLLIIALGACASNPTPTRSSPDNGAIYGYFAIPEDYGVLNMMTFVKHPQQIKAYMGNPTDLQYVIVENAFFAFDAEPGQYYIPKIYSGGARAGISFGSQTRNEFSLIDLKMGDVEGNNARIEKNLISVKPGQMIFLGAQGITLEKRPGLLSSGSFSVGPTASPTEKEILQKLLPALKDTPWEKPVMDKIASLK